MKEDAALTNILTPMIGGREIFGHTPHVTFGDLVSANAKHAKDREHMLQTITQSAHKVLKSHMVNV